jgi:pilus assembly protein CpaC
VHGILKSKKKKTGLRIVALTIGAVALANVARAEAPKVETTMSAMEQPTLVTVPVGLSSVLTAPWPVKRVSVTDPKIADIQQVTPKQLLVSGRGVGMTDIILWNANDESWRARIDVEADRTAIKNELARLFPKAKLEVRQANNVVIVSGTLEDAEDAQDVRRFLDVTGLKYVDMTRVAGLQQVQLKVTIAEASRTAIRMLGINGGYTDRNDPNGAFGASNPGLNQFGNGPGAGGIGTILTETSPNSNITLFGHAHSGSALFSAFVAALADNSYVRIMAEPNLVALSGQEATFLVGGEFPYPVPQSSGGTTGSTITIQFKEFGVRLRFRPTVLGNGAIRLHVAPEVSELDFGVTALTVQGVTVPGLQTRRAETTLEMNSGQTFAMAGLINERTDARNQRVPYLGDVPIIGNLFRSARYQKGETEMLVLVTASLVEPSSVATTPPGPGALHVEPNDWELYGLGRIEGKTTAKLSTVDAEYFRNTGLDRLKGPGAWETYETPGATSTAALSSNSSESIGTGVPNRSEQ